MKINHLTSAEENLMKLFWSLESFRLKDVMEQHAEPKPHQNTISTYLRILVEKGFLTTEKEGRIFKYSIAVPVEEYRNFLLKEIAENFFRNSGKDLLQLLFKENIVTDNDLRDFFDLTIQIRSQKDSEPSFEIAEEILRSKKNKKNKGKKKKKK